MMKAALLKQTRSLFCFFALLKLSEAAGECARGGGREVLEAAAAAAREAEARGERVADAEACAGVQLIKLARERLLRDAFECGVELARGLVETFDEYNFRRAARARTPARVLAESRARVVLNLPRRDYDESSGVRVRLAFERAPRVRRGKVAVAHDEEERLAAYVGEHLRLALARSVARRGLTLGHAESVEYRAEAADEPLAALHHRGGERRGRDELFGALVGDCSAALAAHGVARGDDGERVGRRQAEERAAALAAAYLNLSAHEARAREP